MKKKYGVSNYYNNYGKPKASISKGQDGGVIVPGGSNEGVIGEEGTEVYNSQWDDPSVPVSEYQKAWSFSPEGRGQRDYANFNYTDPILGRSIDYQTSPYGGMSPFKFDLSGMGTDAPTSELELGKDFLGGSGNIAPIIGGGLGAIGSIIAGLLEPEPPDRAKTAGRYPLLKQNPALALAVARGVFGRGK